MLLTEQPAKPNSRGRAYFYCAGHLYGNVCADGEVYIQVEFTFAAPSRLHVLPPEVARVTSRGLQHKSDFTDEVFFERIVWGLQIMFISLQ